MFSIAEISKTSVVQNFVPPNLFGICQTDNFTIGASYDIEFAIIRAEHMCMHPVVTHSSWDGLQGGYTRFEIQIGD